MPYTLYGQPAQRYKASKTRPKSKLNTIPEFNAKKMWKSLFQTVKKYKTVMKRGRFTVLKP
jgi:hypothetical protein